MRAQWLDKIYELIPSSTITDHQKEMLRILLPVMDDNQVENVYNALVKEEADMNRIDEKMKRILFKQEMVADKFKRSSAENKKKINLLDF